MLNLEELLAAGGYIDPTWETIQVTWKDGKNTYEFTVQGKTQMSPSDHEFIYLGLGDKRKDSDKKDPSMMARRVSRMAKIFNPKTDAYEPVPLAVAERMKPSLLMAICTKLNEVEIAPETEDEAEKN